MRRHLWILGLAAPLWIAAVLLLADSRSATANAQQAPAKAAEVKLDNFSFGPQTLTVAGRRQ